MHDYEWLSHLVVKLPLELSDRNYELSYHGMICQEANSGSFDTFKEAIDSCYNNGKCRGIQDKYCDGNVILTCSKFTSPKKTDSSCNGCTYLNKGRNIFKKLPKIS